MKNNTFLLLLTILMTTLPSFAEESTTPIDPERQWNSLLPIGLLELFPKATRQKRIGAIEAGEVWNKLWTAWRPDTEIPLVDFQSEVVVFAKNVRYLNRLRVPTVTQAEGVATLTIHETRSARPIRDKLNCVMFVIKRKNIQSISDGRTRFLLTIQQQQ